MPSGIRTRTSGIMVPAYVAATITISSDTQAWVNAVTGAGGSVSDDQKTRVNTLITSLRTHNLFTNLDRLWIYAGESSPVQASIDIISLSTHSLVASPALSSQGYTGDGATSYIESNFVPPSGNFQLNTCSFGAYVTAPNGTTTNATVIIGNQNTGTTAICDIINLIAANTMTQRINQFGGDMSDSTTNGNRRGFFVVTSTGGGSQTAYQNNSGSALGTGIVQRSVPAFEFFVCARNDNGTASSFSTDTAGASFIGGALTSGDVVNLANDLNTYMTSWGVNVF